jgi:hypothetical protein
MDVNKVVIFERWYNLIITDTRRNKYQLFIPKLIKAAMMKLSLPLRHKKPDYLETRTLNVV